MESCENCGNSFNPIDDDVTCQKCKQKSQQNNSDNVDLLLIGDDNTANDLLIINSVNSDFRNLVEAQEIHHVATEPIAGLEDVVITEQPLTSVDVDGVGESVEINENLCDFCDCCGECECNCCEGCGDCDCDCGDCGECVIL